MCNNQSSYACTGAGAALPLARSLRGDEIVGAALAHRGAVLGMAGSVPHLPRGIGSTASAVFCLAVASVAAGGCSGAGMETSAIPSAALDALPSLPRLELPKAPPPNVGTPIEIYERVGRQLRQCWLMPGRPLSASHLFEAAAEPAHKGGNSQIVIRERDGEETGQKARGSRAYTITITADPASPERSLVETATGKLAADKAAELDRQVRAWAAGAQGCEIDAAGAAWAAQAGSEAAQTNAKKAVSGRSKPKAAAARQQGGQ